MKLLVLQFSSTSVTCSAPVKIFSSAASVLWASRAQARTQAHTYSRRHFVHILDNVMQMNANTHSNFIAESSDRTSVGPYLHNSPSLRKSNSHNPQKRQSVAFDAKCCLRSQIALQSSKIACISSD
jgi:hypothetical protein